MRVVEIFKSIQGEGNDTGLVTVFVRLQGCNLKCEWCDTKYSRSEGTEYSVEKVIDEVKSFRCPNVCVTGGEPLIHTGIRDLLQSLSVFANVCVMTNGTMDIRSFIRKDIRWVVDYKCGSANPDLKFNICNLYALGEEDELKFVIDSRSDYEEAKLFMYQYINFEHSFIIRMSPTGRMKRHLARWIIKDNFSRLRYSLQVHKAIWGGKRGV